jgi:hypothetical protein
MGRLYYAIGWMKKSEQEVGEKMRSKFILITKDILSEIKRAVFFTDFMREQVSRPGPNFFLFRPWRLM